MFFVKSKYLNFSSNFFNSETVLLIIYNSFDSTKKITLFDSLLALKRINEIKELFENSKNLTSKWSNYFNIYENLFKAYKNKDITFVENSEGDIVRYDYSNTKIRNKPVKLKLIKALAAAVKASGVDFVTITSGLQPGTTGRRIGSGRHDTGLAADLFVTYKGRKLDRSKIQDQAILTRFIQAAIVNGIKAGGMSKGYMGNFTMHLDMLGAHDGKGGYSGTFITWRSDSWFVNALKGSTT
jgi:hypothetical protein